MDWFLYNRERHHEKANNAISWLDITCLFKNIAKKKIPTNIVSYSFLYVSFIFTSNNLFGKKNCFVQLSAISGITLCWHYTHNSLRKKSKSQVNYLWHKQI